MRNRVRTSGERAEVDEILARTRAFASASGDVNVVSISSAYAIKSSDDVVLAFGGAYSITLPAPTRDRQITIKDASFNSGTSNKTILPTGSATIDGDPSFILNVNAASVTLTSDGVNWYVTGAYNGETVT
jgi:hypothetical protein